MLDPKRQLPGTIAQRSATCMRMVAAVKHMNRSADKVFTYMLPQKHVHVVHFTTINKV